jgi:hypothetical protein
MSVRPSWAVAVGAVLLVLLLALALGGGARAPARAGTAPIEADSSGSLTASVGGTHLLGLGGHTAIYFNATGGPAYAANGSRVGNLTYYASLSGPNTTGATLNPDQDAIFNGSAPVSTLTVGSVAESLTINVMFSSVYQSQNQSLNLSFTVHVVEPYVLSATVEDVSSSSVLGFPVLIYLDGSVVGNVTVGTLASNHPYHFTFDYLTLGLSPGWHTFSISLAGEHGLVVFAGGSTTFQQSFYVPGPAPDYTIWYIVGVVAFVGTIFILVTRVAARRRGAARK